MTKSEKHEIACVTRAFIGDECDEIRKEYKKLFGSLNGLRKYIHNELVAFWTEGDPYLDEHYLDRCWMEVGSKIINADDAWCWIRDGLKFSSEHYANKL